MRNNTKYSSKILKDSRMKVNSSFLLNQFLINGFRSPFTFRFDKNQNGGGFMLYIIEDITFNTFMRIHLDNR